MGTMRLDSFSKGAQVSKKYVDLDKVLDRVGKGLTVAAINIAEIEGLLMAAQPTAEVLDKLERVKKGHAMIDSYLTHLRKPEGEGGVIYQTIKVEN